MGRKLGEAVLFFGGRAGSPSKTISPGPRSTSLPSAILIHPAVWPQQTWAENWGGKLCPYGGAGSPSNTMLPGPRFTSLPSAILIHLAVWAHRHGTEIGGCTRFGEAWSPSNSVARAEAYLHVKFHLDPHNRLATIHQRHRQTGHRQRSDSIGQTVLQTLAQ